MNTAELSPLALAFLGDSIHTTFVRLGILKGKKEKLNTYNNLAKSFCNAKAQSEALEKVTPLLSEDEKEIIRKTRNTHNKHSSKNFDEETYKRATSFEALIGYLYLENRIEKMIKILKNSMEN